MNESPNSPTPLILDEAASLRDLLRRAPVLESKVTSLGPDLARDAEPLLGEVIRFLHLCCQSPRPLGPSARIDQVWHEMILCTRAYREWCQAHLGRFVDHAPDQPGSRNPAALMRTVKLYHRHFGPLPHQLWGLEPDSPILANCGSCENAAPQT